MSNARRKADASKMRCLQPTGRRKADSFHLTCWNHVCGRISWLMHFSETSAVRFWFAFASLGFASFMFFGNTVHNVDSEYRYMLRIAPHQYWAIAFSIHGLATLYGVLARQFNTALMTLEGILGTVVWVMSAVAMTFAQSTPGAAAVGACIAAWLCFRYPPKVEYLQ